jgi:hypothetical protein
MHIAVSKGAKPGGQFIKYVEYLAAQNYVLPDAKPWVDHIRQKGNEAKPRDHYHAKGGRR